MRVFRVLKPGLLTTVQDLGRYGFLKYGVPVSGAMDTFSLVTANLLAGNQRNEACLETTLTGPELQVLTDTQIAITGGFCAPKVNGQSVMMWQTLTLQEDDVVSFGRMEGGCHAYVAVRGGIDTPIVLGSRSTYVRGGFGGVDGRQLKAGDVIEGVQTTFLKTESRLPEELTPRFAEHLILHVVLGPQADMFTDKGIETLLSNVYSVALEVDRMGYRLGGPMIENRGKADIVSDALLPGAIQVPKNGKPMVMMRDAQTTGGYPKIAVVITPDLDILGQAKPNHVVEFAKVTMYQAHERICEYYKLLSDLNRRLKKR
jgi:biotin-dependent carboxylase-like uncharacterized protein